MLALYRVQAKTGCRFVTHCNYSGSRNAAMQKGHCAQFAAYISSVK
jgi:hypothetical protein